MLARIGEKVREATVAKGWPVTLSMGVITFVKTDLPVPAMIKRTDDLMYHAKRTGKNRIEHEVYE